MADDKAVEIFREYIRINTMHPQPDYVSAIKLLKRIANELDLPTEVVEVIPGNPILLMTWKGEDASLPSVLLNSHMDVVPVFPEYWKHDPFAAVMEDNGDIYGRGTQDMKSVGIQYLEAVRILKSQNFKPLRTIILSFVPDEEVGGVRGVKPFVQTPEFRKLNVGFSLDEGMASPTDTYVVYYGERSRYVVDVNAVGNPGHGSQFIKGTASEKILKFMGKFEEFRNQEKIKLLSDPKLHLGDVTTTNLTMLNGGIQNNVVPAKIRAEFDCRVATTFPANNFKEMIHKWAHESDIAVEDVNIHFFEDHIPNTVTDDSNPWWKAFIDVCAALKLKTRLEIFPAATDSRFFRQIGIPAIGFSPMIHTPILLHDHNEFINRKIFTDGIQTYVPIIKALSKIPKF